MVQEWQISRLAQDELALKSHQNANAAYETGFYDDLVFEFMNLKRDGIVRADTTLEKLEKLKVAFDFTGKGTLTAGNSSPLTDGAAAVYLACEETTKQFNYTPLARFIDAQSAAATGARIVATLAKMLQQKGRGRGLISICTAGGMGVAAILEAV